MTAMIDHTKVPVSYSRIEAFDCPHYFRKRYLEKEGFKSSRPLLIGNFIHSVVDLYIKALKEKGLEADAELLDNTFERSWRGEHSLPETLYDEVKDILVRFGEHFHINPDTLFGSEIQYAFDWNLSQVAWFGDTVWLRGKLDKVDVYGKQAIITDFKTNMHAPPEGDLKKSLQGKIYAWMLKMANPFLEEFTVIYDFMRYGIKREVTVEEGDFDIVEKRLRSFSMRVGELCSNEEAEWPAQLSNVCPICSFECPLIETGVKVIRTTEDATEIAKSIIASKASTKKMEEALKRYVKKSEEVVDVGIGTYANRYQESVSAPISELVQLCLDKGVDPKNVLSFDSTKFKKLTDEEFREDILKIATVKGSTRVSYKDKDKDEE